MNLIEKLKGNKTIQRLFNIETREVSLVDHPAINEPFIEVKNQGGGQDTNVIQKEANMDEKKVKDMIAEYLSPIAKALDGIKAKFEEIEKVTAESTKSKKETEDGIQKTLEDFKKIQDQIIEETGKRFDDLEEFVSTPRSQKISGNGSGDGEKKKPLWPTIVGL
jgi:DNA-directed RNA polymerase subunit L